MNRQDLEGRTCSCHTNPPCSFCIDRSIVEAIESCDKVCASCDLYQDCEKEEKDVCEEKYCPEIPCSHCKCKP